MSFFSSLSAVSCSLLIPAYLFFPSVSLFVSPLFSVPLNVSVPCLRLPSHLLHHFSFLLLTRCITFAFKSLIFPYRHYSYIVPCPYCPIPFIPQFSSTHSFSFRSSLIILLIKLPHFFSLHVASFPSFDPVLLTPLSPSLPPPL